MRNALCMFLAVTFIAAAGVICPGRTPVIDRRERQQQARIRQGVRSGELTRREAARLEREEGRIRGYEAYAKRDGRVTPHERQRMDRMLDRADRNIYREKHDYRHRVR